MNERLQTYYLVRHVFIAELAERSLRERDELPTLTPGGQRDQHVAHLGAWLRYGKDRPDLFDEAGHSVRAFVLRTWPDLNERTVDRSLLHLKKVANGRIGWSQRGWLN